MPILKSITFVLGAGASAPFGLPVGRSLRDLVCALAPGQAAYTLLRSLDHSDADIQAFTNELRYSGWLSVDRFLEKNSDYLAIGKHATAAIMLPLEDERYLFPPTAGAGHWYEHLASAMDPGSDGWKENKLSVVTFNYDRSLEHYLCRVIAQRKRVALDDASRELEHLPLVHVHGALGPYPTAPESLTYGAAATTDSVARAAKSLLVVGEVADTLPTFGIANEFIERASDVYFLGFGFLHDNIRRLRAFSKQRPAGSTREVGGTTMGITNLGWEKIRAESFNGHWTHGIKPHLGVLEYLLNYVSFE